MRRSRPARTALLSGALLLLSGAAWAQPAEELPARQIEAIESAISGAMSRLGIPGLSVAVATDHRLRWSNGYGFSDIENYVPAKAATVYRLGSTSKPITATAVMQLVEEGKLDLDAPVQKYQPSFPEKPWTVTPRLLLGHLGGIRHYAEGEFGSTRHYASVAEALDIFKDAPLAHEPGTKFLYTTYGYNLLGAVVEGASGTRFLDYLREKIFRPAGMERTGPDDVFAIIPNRARGYTRGMDGELLNSGLADTSNKIPGGGLCSTAPDVARFALALETELLVRKETLALMFTSQKTKAGKPTGYGLGWRVGEFRAHKEAFHTGGQQRVSTLLYLQPDRRLAVVLLTNLENISSALVDLAREMSSELLP